jgi:saccharopine dehydrogenase-like NADP-dependent oxidoreductase
MQERHILILGSGFVSEPIIDYLLQRDENILTICSNNQTELDRLQNKIIKNEKNLKTKFLDVVEEKENLINTIKEHELVISLIPAFLLIHVAKACLKIGRNLITTSYISDNIKKMEKEIKEKNLIFMFESGINPGLDHIIAYKVIREETNQGNTIIGYESWVGAIPSPEFVDNPLLYKFSWSPKGALLALKNEARQLINGKVVKINERDLLSNHVVDKQFHPSLNLEGYYNRDSLKYKELYNLKDARSVIRGIIRYQGFTFIIQCFKFLNLFSFDKPDKKNWREHLNKLLKNPRIQDIIYDMKNRYIRKGQEILIYNVNTSDSIAEKMFYFNLSLLAISYFDDKYTLRHRFELLFNRIYSALMYLDLYNEKNEVNIIITLVFV